MSQGKIEPLIAAAEQRSTKRTEVEIHALINAIDNQIAVLEAQLELKLEQITERLNKLEDGVSPQPNG